MFLGSMDLAKCYRHLGDESHKSPFKLSKSFDATTASYLTVRDEVYSCNDAVHGHSVLSQKIYAKKIEKAKLSFIRNKKS